MLCKAFYAFILRCALPSPISYRSLISSYGTVAQFILRTYLKQSNEMLFDALNQCLLALGDVPERGIDYNTETAVDRTLNTSLAFHRSYWRITLAKYYALSFLTQYPVNVVLDFHPGRLIDVHEQGTCYRVTAIVRRSDARVDTGTLFVLRNTCHLDHWCRVGEATIAYGAGCFLNEMHDVFGTQHVKYSEIEAATLGED